MCIRDSTDPSRIMYATHISAKFFWNIRQTRRLFCNVVTIWYYYCSFRVPSIIASFLFSKIFPIMFFHVSYCFLASSLFLPRPPIFSPSGAPVRSLQMTSTFILAYFDYSLLIQYLHVYILDIQSSSV